MLKSVIMSLVEAAVIDDEVEESKRKIRCRSAIKESLLAFLNDLNLHHASHFRPLTVPSLS